MKTKRKATNYFEFWILNFEFQNKSTVPNPKSEISLPPCMQVEILIFFETKYIINI